MRTFAWVLFFTIGAWVLVLVLWTNKLRQETDSLAWSAANFSAVVSRLQNNSQLSKSTSTLVFAGDIMLSREVGGKMEKNGDWEWPFKKIKNYLAGADFAFANLESPISDKGENQGSIYSFRADPRSVAGLSAAGLDALSLANNHIWDWGVAALTDTMFRLRTVGIMPVGAGSNQEEANRGEILDIKGVKVGLLAYTDLYPDSLAATGERPGISKWEWQKVLSDIERLRKEADILVVSWHSGEEYKDKPNLEQEQKYRGLIEAGADLVIGHHPHVVQPLEKYGKGWIAYSLGNFIFDQNFSEATMSGAVLEVHLLGNKIETVELRPVLINKDFQPSLQDL